MKEKFLIYRLFNRLDPQNRLKFQKYIRFYFTQEDDYIHLFKLIEESLNQYKLDDHFPEKFIADSFSDSKVFSIIKNKFKTCLKSFLRHQILEKPNKNEAIIACRNIADLNVLYINGELKRYELDLKKAIKTAKNLGNFAFAPILEAYYTNYCAYYNRDKNALKNLEENYQNFQDAAGRFNDNFECIVLVDKMVLTPKNNLSRLDEIYTRYDNIYKRTKDKSIELLCLRGFAFYYRLKKNSIELHKTLNKILPLFEHFPSTQYYIEAKESTIVEMFYNAINLNLKEEAEKYLKINSKLQKQYRYSNKVFLDEYLTRKLNYTFYFIKDKNEIRNYLNEVRDEKKLIKNNSIENSSNEYLRNESFCLFIIDEYAEVQEISDYILYTRKFLDDLVFLTYVFSAYHLFDTIRLKYVYRNLKRIINTSKNTDFKYINHIMNYLYNMRFKKNNLNDNNYNSYKNKIYALLKQNSKLFSVEHFTNTLLFKNNPLCI